MITSELKDELLNKLLDLSNETGKLRFSCSLIDVAKELDVSLDIVRKLIKHFQNRGLIGAALTKDKVSSVAIDLEIEAFDFHKLGFRGEEIFRKQKIEKLVLELEQLKPSFVEKTQEIDSILKTVKQAFSMLLFTVENS